MAVPLLVGVSPASRWLSAPLVLVDPLRRADAIAVLGAGAYDPRTPTPHTAYRLLRAVQLYQEGYAPLMILSGGGHRGARGTDAEAMATAARALGVPATAVVLDATSSSTRAQAESVARIARSRGLSSVLVVTSPLGSRRATRAFRQVGLDAVSASVSASPPLEVSRDHIAGRLVLVMDALYEHLATGLYAWRGWI
jgi:uncharacterized SAM-binding protein YcdF (DUF218 family)